MVTSEEIKRRLWNGANELRGSMDASRYKDYMLGLMFYKFLSDKTLETFRISAGLEQMPDIDLLEEYFKAKSDYGDQLEKMIQNVLGYYVSPEFLYQTWLRDINAGTFEVQKVTDSLNSFERTIAVTGDADDFKGLFSNSTLDLTDTALGSNLNERSKNIKALIMLFADLNMVDLQKGDVLGDAYEYLIGMFAMESGKKAGEFYTPHQVSEVIARIVTKSSNIKSVYDAAVGSGSLLLTVKSHLSSDAQKDLEYYGQEKNTATYNLTRMNLLLHGVRPEKMTIRNGDTLAADWPEDPSKPDEGILFDAVVMNPPYSAKHWNRSGLKVSDPRFEVAGVLPPDSKGDYAFLLHGLYHLGPKGTMGIVLPHGVLFRGASEGEIRKRLLDKNYIDTIIGLPANLFTNTGIPVVIIILKKNRSLDAPVLIIDASKNCIKEGKQNTLQEKDIARIVDTYAARSETAGYSHLATHTEIAENEYNLNIPRYMDSTDLDIPDDVDAHLYGGIPKRNIDSLKALKMIMPDIMNKCFETVRPGYCALKKPISVFEDEVLNDEHVLSTSLEIKELTDKYINKYWNLLRHVTSDTNTAQIMEEMLSEIKSILSEYPYIDSYDGYQMIAEIWKNSIAHDIEIIANNGFYDAGRIRQPLMVVKGSGKNRREEQDGWVGSITPNELILNLLYSSDKKAIDEKQNQISEDDSVLSDLVEASKVEDSNEYVALYEMLKKNDDDEPGDTFDQKLIKSELKEADRNSEEYPLLKKADSLISEKSALAREIKEDETALNHAVQDRIVNLTDKEIDQLIYKKWFGDVTDGMVSLVRAPLKADLDTLSKLQDKYADTLTDIDGQIENLTADFEKMQSELVVL